MALTRPDQAPISCECADCGRRIAVPAMWAGVPGHDRHYHRPVQRRLICSRCLERRRHVIWAGLDTDPWALITDRMEPIYA